MAHDFPVPDEAQLERLIVSVYKRLPDPEFPRLNRIEERLARNLPTGKTRRKANTIPWWIVLLLTGGIAAAVWWAGVRYTEVIENKDREATGIKSDTIQPADTPRDSTAPQERGQDSQSDAANRKQSPIIYQREH